MERSILLLFIAFSTICFGQKSLDSNAQIKVKAETKYTFDKTLVELGEIKKGDKKSFDYTMTNTGTENIKISYVSYCECTTVEYQKSKELKPGESMKFDVVFDSTTKDEEETIEIEVELENIDVKTGLPIYFTLDYHFNIVK